MQVVLKPMLDKVLDTIDKYGSENLLRIDLDEVEFGNLHKDISSKEFKSSRSFNQGTTILRASKDAPWIGSHYVLDGVCVQCSYK